MRGFIRRINRLSAGSTARTTLNTRHIALSEEDIQMELLSPGHLVVIAIVAAVLLFGWKQLPDMSRSLGRSLRIFRTEIRGMANEAHEMTEDVKSVADDVAGPNGQHPITAPRQSPSPTPPAVDNR